MLSQRNARILIVLHSHNTMIILAIETSCDDTCAALIKCSPKNKEFSILSNVVSSQVKIHREYGGVYPALAKRAHQKNLVPVLNQALSKAGMLKKTKTRPDPKQNTLDKAKIKKAEKILEREQDLLKKLKKFLEKQRKPCFYLSNGKQIKIGAIAVTIGPGLEPCLWVGTNFARALSCYWNLPIVSINHIEAHILANFLPKVSSKSQIPDHRSQINSKLQIQNSKQIFPAICLVVSGGHTQIILTEKIGKYKILGETRDDAAGECLDKIARILGLGYPGGPMIAAEAAKLKTKNCGKTKLFNRLKFPRPMIYQKNYDFSFSGLKTAALYDFKKRSKKIRESKKYIQAVADESQQAVIDVLIHKTLKAAKKLKAKSILLGGGVTANKKLRKQFKQAIKKMIPDSGFRVPDPKFCADNASMIGITACSRSPFKKNVNSWQKIKVNSNLRLS